MVEEGEPTGGGGTITYTRIFYQPGQAATFNLVGDPILIARTSLASSLVEADLNVGLSLQKPETDQLIVRQIAALVHLVSSWTPDSHHCHFRVYVDQMDDDHKLFDVDISDQAVAYFTSHCNASELPAVFALLTDGEQHTFYLFLWADEAGIITVNEVEILFGIGNENGGSSGSPHLEFNFEGLATTSVVTSTQGLLD